MLTKALWRPGWYELDQELQLGMQDEFWFCSTLPEGVRPGISLAFHNPLLSPDPPVMQRGTIREIVHPELGQIERVQTKGLTYKVTLLGGSTLGVETEESPGVIEGVPEGSPLAGLRVASWDLVVDFEALP